MSASGGDMRKAVTFLQSSHQLSGGAPVSMKMVTDIGGQVCDENAQINYYDAGTLYDECILNYYCYCVIIFDNNVQGTYQCYGFNLEGYAWTIL